MGKGVDRSVVTAENTKEEKKMRVAINDISFLKGFTKIAEAKEALTQFAAVAFRLRDERISKVDMTVDIVNDSTVNKSLELAPQYTLMKALNDIRSDNMERYLWILQILAMVGEEAEDNLEEFCLLNHKSRHCARYKNDFLLSIVSHEIFAQKTVKGLLSNGKECAIRNIAEESHIDFYWEELGFRLYELNPKHGAREYIRAGGEKVGIAPESAELGQRLLNQAIQYKGKLFAVDRDRNDRVFEFRHSYANKYHCFLREDLPENDRKRIVEMAR